MLSFLYNELLWRPLFNGLILFYTLLPFHDLGVAIVFLTLALRVLLFPLFWKAKKAQKGLEAIQPEIKKIQERFRADKEAQGRALMELYSQHKVNPLGGCLPVLVQLPVLIALFQIFQSAFKAEYLSYLYPFVPNPGSLSPLAFGFLDLSKGSIYFGVVAAAAQYLQMRLTTKISSAGSHQGEFMAAFQKQSMYVFPAMLLVWSYYLPSALILSWTASSLLGILEDTLFRRVIAGRISSTGGGVSAEGGARPAELRQRHQGGPQ